MDTKDQDSSRINFLLDGEAVSLPGGSRSLLDALRYECGKTNVKDGCSPQGQCGCCTVLIDGQARVACVTALSRVNGKTVTTSVGLEGRDQLADAFLRHGASQCGFCTPGILARLEGLKNANREVDETAIRRALGAHLCKCTGWQSIVNAAKEYFGLDATSTDFGADKEEFPKSGTVTARATLEGPRKQVINHETVLGRFHFASDYFINEIPVGVFDDDGAVVVGENVADARRCAVQTSGRNSTIGYTYPVSLPASDTQEWAITLRTTFVEPGYLEPDAAFVNGETVIGPLENGGAFGGKRESTVIAAANELAEKNGGAAGFVWRREDVVERGHKRPPIALALRDDESGIVCIAKTPHSVGIEELAAAMRTRFPALDFQIQEVSGPPLSGSLRAGVLLEVMAARAALRAKNNGWKSGDEIEIEDPRGGRVRVRQSEEGLVAHVYAGRPLSEPTLRSYSFGALHQGLSLVRSEGIGIDETGRVVDRTIRSFGIASASQTPPLHVVIEEQDSDPVPVSDALFIASATLCWLEDGLVEKWPTRGANP